MIYFENNRLVNFEDLKQAANEDGERIYSENLIQKIQNGDFNALYDIDIADRNNKYFMEPLLFAVKNSEFSTYEVYKYYGEELQKIDLTIASEIVINEPNVFEDTAIADDPTSVLYLAKFNPEIVLYMSDDLKSNGYFLEELSEINKEVMSYVAKECNIAKVIEQNPELANNAEFIKEACKVDNKVIDYVAQHTNEFGEEALRATQEVLREIFNIKVNEECKEEAIRLRKEIEQQEMEGKEADYRLIARKNRIEKRPELLDERLKGLENGDPKAIRYAHRILKICKNMNENDREMLEQSLKIGEAIAEKQKEENKEQKINPMNIENLSRNAKLSEIQEETKAIREEITAQKNQTKENEELGEK